VAFLLHNLKTQAQGATFFAFRQMGKSGARDTTIFAEAMLSKCNAAYSTMPTIKENVRGEN
jgi:hypothetical protein